MTGQIRKSTVFLLAATGALVAAFALFCKCSYDRTIREIDSEAMRLGAEDVARRISEGAAKLGDPLEVAAIASTSRIGRGGRVAILQLSERDNHSGLKVWFQINDTDSGRIASIQSDCGNYRIVVTMPYRGWWLADDRPYQSLVVLMIALLVGILLSGVGMLDREGIVRTVSEAKALFQPIGDRVKTRRHRTSPIVVVSLALFVLGFVIVWIVSMRAYREHFEEVMLRGIDDFVEDYNSAPDSCLYFVGNAITSHYRTPEKATQLHVRELMSRYGIDELNVVDRNGVVLKGDLANVGFDFHSTSNTAKFLRLLGNDWTYAQNFRAAVEDPSIVRKYAGVAFPKHNGFVQIGFDEKRIAEDFDYRLTELAQDWALGSGGYFVLARTDGTIVSSGHHEFLESLAKGETSTLAGVGFDISLIPTSSGKGNDKHEFFVARLYGDRCLCVSKQLGNYHCLIVALPLSAIESSRNESLFFYSLIVGLLLGAVTWVGSRLSKLVAQLKAFIAEDAKRRLADLTVAKTIQTSSLPVIFPDNEDFAISARMRTAREVGGDFFDFYQVPSGRIFFLVADTSGKGVPAAMFMMKAKAIIKSCVFDADDFAEAIKEANNRLSANNDANMFVTAWMGVFDAKTGEVEYVNAGHNPPLVKGADGQVRWIRSRPGLALAAMEGVGYRVERFTLEKGATLFLYTDGVTEALNNSGDFYGEPLLEKTLAETGSDNLIESVDFSLTSFVNGAEQADDITMLTVKRK